MWGNINMSKIKSPVNDSYTNIRPKGVTGVVCLHYNVYTLTGCSVIVDEEPSRAGIFLASRIHFKLSTKIAHILIKWHFL